MSTNLKRDIIAIILAVLIIVGIAFKTLFPDAFASRPAVTLSLEDASKRLERIISWDGTYITRIDSQALEPVVYEALALTVNDYGAANDILFVAELVEKFNDGGSVEHLREALAIVNEIRQRASIF
ncbi:hypothetical protein FHS16_003554 [Paenibacillus endophyticus]|uniref:Uncharacterized protein n=1 Tax=Paenibacillus endophyticus TaxID=1294268 RepID=A0A7W5GC03_9BACL|nr:hypothetical protein [Paenibacillus endophyticus]MBB3153492.1 hypothetical protein [Paenibacillus endophyticus]